MLVRELQYPLAYLILRDCYRLELENPQQQFDQETLLKRNTVTLLQPYIILLKSTFGITKLPIIKKPIRDTKGCIKLLRQLGVFP